jgi:hypothetical protein
MLAAAEVARSRPDEYAGGMTAKTWFISGASRGFGREWAIAALERGDSVAAGSAGSWTTLPT